jgi:simple sugar transport system ATP-binding protein
MQKNVLSMEGISKAFSGVPALKGVDLQLVGGEVHALLGANGAGKSTLMKILSGAYNSDVGRIKINGDEVKLSSPIQAQQHGIHIVHQEVDTAIIPTVSVKENIMLSAITHSAHSVIRWKAYTQKAEDGSYYDYSSQIKCLK